MVDVNALESAKFAATVIRSMCDELHPIQARLLWLMLLMSAPKGECTFPVDGDSNAEVF
jgi:hypothetical protein